jgi:hypothetical protein
LKVRIKSGTNEHPVLTLRRSLSPLRPLGTWCACVALRAPGAWFARVAPALVLGGALALLGGCASGGAARGGASHGATLESEQARLWMSEHQHVVAIHRSKCGACHTPVEPGSVPRAEVASALQRHRQRAKLSEKDWSDMVEYLSSDGPLVPHRSASLP